MAAQQILNIVADHELKQKLLILIEQQKMLDASQEVFKQEKARIGDECKQLGLKPTEFTKIVKFSNNEELAYNELAFVESIVDNLLDRK
jgi:hypothetical protein